jgi:peptidoglycan hydrolase CwlO-like protein
MYNYLKEKFSTLLILSVAIVLFFVLLNFIFTFMNNSKVDYIKTQMIEVQEEINEIQIDNKSLDKKFENFNVQIKDIDKNIEKNNQSINNLNQDEKTTIDSIRNYSPNEWERYFADRYKQSSN